MKLVTFEQLELPADFGVRGRGRPRSGALEFEAAESGRRRLGAVIETGARSGDIADLNRALALELAQADGGAPEAEASSLLPGEMSAFLGRGQVARQHAEAALAWTLDALERYDGPT